MNLYISSIFDLSKLPDTYECCFMVFEWGGSTGIDDDGHSEIPVMGFASHARDGEVGRDSSDHDFLNPLLSQVGFEIRLIKRTDSRFSNRLFCRVISEFIEKCSRPGIFLKDSKFRYTGESRRNLRTIIIVRMKTEMHPDDFLMLLSKNIDEFPDICYSTVFCDEFSHSKGSYFSFGMEEFIDKIDEDKSAWHRVCLRKEKSYTIDPKYQPQISIKLYSAYFCTILQSFFLATFIHSYKIKKLYPLTTFVWWILQESAVPSTVWRTY